MTRPYTRLILTHESSWSGWQFVSTSLLIAVIAASLSYSMQMSKYLPSEHGCRLRWSVFTKRAQSDVDFWSTPYILLSNAGTPAMVMIDTRIATYLVDGTLQR